MGAPVEKWAYFTKCDFCVCGEHLLCRTVIASWKPCRMFLSSARVWLSEWAVRSKRGANVAPASLTMWHLLPSLPLSNPWLIYEFDASPQVYIMCMWSCDRQRKHMYSLYFNLSFIIIEQFLELHSLFVSSLPCNISASSYLFVICLWKNTEMK